MNHARLVHRPMVDGGGWSLQQAIDEECFPARTQCRSDQYVQNASNRAGGTCDSQNEKKTASKLVAGTQEKMSANIVFDVAELVPLPIDGDDFR